MNEEFVKKKAKIQLIQYCQKVFKYKYRYSINHSKRDEYGVIQLAAVCPFHGKFKVPLHSHKKGVGCLKCEEMGNSLTFDDFIKLAVKIHGNTYQYHRPLSFRQTDKIKARCKDHGDFYQTVYSHLHGSGCQDCAKGIRSVEQFLRDANRTHDNKYTYEGLTSPNVSGDVTVICPIHGGFKMNFQAHLGGGGCRNCTYTDSHFYIYCFVFTNGKKRFYKLGLAKDVVARHKQLARSLHSSWKMELLTSFKYLNHYGAFSCEYKMLSSIPGDPIPKCLLPDGWAETKDVPWTPEQMLEAVNKVDRWIRKNNKTYVPERQLYNASMLGKKRMERRRLKSAARKRKKEKENGK